MKKVVKAWAIVGRETERIQIVYLYKPFKSLNNQWAINIYGAYGTWDANIFKVVPCLISYSVKREAGKKVEG